eukprot:6492365-Amphidinium_carterae.2
MANEKAILATALELKRAIVVCDPSSCSAWAFVPELQRVCKRNACKMPFACDCISHISGWRQVVGRSVHSLVWHLPMESCPTCKVEGGAFP